MDRAFSGYKAIIKKKHFIKIYKKKSRLVWMDGFVGDHFFYSHDLFT